MTVAIADVGRCGRLDIAFARRGGATVIRDSYCEVPFKITRLHAADGCAPAQLILMHCTAGLFGGDRLECALQLDPGARVMVTPQSATRIHPSLHPPSGLPAVQDMRISVASGAELLFDGEPVIPFAGSRYRQTTHLEVTSGAHLAFWEGLMAGRIGKGELWQFEELASETQLKIDGVLLFLDRFRLQPLHPSLHQSWQVQPSSPWSMGHSPYAGTGLYFGADAPRVAERLHESLPQAGVDLLETQLMVMRVCAPSGPEFYRARQTFREISSSH